MQIDTSIFKALDIRGVYGQNLDEKIAYAVGRGYSDLIKKENPGKKLKIVLSRDMRTSSPSLHTQTLQGLLDGGVDVVDIGLSSTPTFYFAVAYYGYDGGMQVSASHNPPQWNGFKMVRAGGVPVGGETGIKEIQNSVEQENFTPVLRKGVVENKTDVLVDLIKSQTSQYNLNNFKRLKVVIDPANGMGILDLEKLFTQIPQIQVVWLNNTLDGTFPGHEADPLKDENLTQIKSAIRENKADLGIATDGDADRYFFLDENAELIKPYILQALIAKKILKVNPGSTIGYDVRQGRILKQVIEENGGTPLITPVGHSKIKKLMLENNAIFSGEMSGHFFIKFDYGTFEAPVNLTSMLLDVFSHESESISSLWKKYDVNFHSGEINSDVNNHEIKIKLITEKYKEGRQSYFDGITIEFPDYWFNVRSSVTENKLRLNLEAKTKDLMEQKRDEVLALIRS